MRRAGQGRGLRAVVFVDTVGSTQIAATLGDKRWQELLRRELLILRGLLRERGGHEVDTAGDGLFALFREPAPAVRFAASACEAVRAIGLEVRAGVHFGEVEFSEGRPGGIVVHTGARTMSIGGAGEVLVTQTVRELGSGGDLSFAEHGTHELKGVPGHWPLFRLTEVDQKPMSPPLADDEADTRRREESVPVPLVRRRTFLAGIATAAVAGSVGTYVLTRDEEPAVSRPRDNRVFRFEPATDQLTMLPSKLSVPAGNFLACVAVGEGGVWVGGSVLHHVDPQNGEVVDLQVATAGGLPLVNDVTTGADDVWFVDIRAVYRIDPADDELLDSYRFDVEQENNATSALPTSVVVGFDSVWVCLEDGSLFRFDAGAQLRRPTRVSLNGVLSDLVVTAGALWVADEFGRIIRLDPDSLRVTPIDVGGQPKALTATDDRVWAVDPAGIVIVVDLEARREAERIPVEGDLVDIAAGLGAVWVADHHGDVIELDPALRRVVGRTSVGGPISALAVDEERGVVWIRTSPLPINP
jgi:class 3 adenylate cyclase/streptogramin lyase